MGISGAVCVWLALTAIGSSQDVSLQETAKPKFDPIAATVPIVTQVADLVNQERAKYKLPALRVAERLNVTARWHAMDMAIGNYFDHTDRQGRTVGQRLSSMGYRYNYCGQNIAAGQKTPAEVVAAWMNSPPHRENILRREFREMGLAYVENENSKYTRYWVQDFGTP
ncbi:MAG TPA: CAP domain-containing protein [Fimbriimonadaceae bacterium]|nr:CAP domain-containing protein [Fimbriimonadaceae bacterium]